VPPDLVPLVRRRVPETHRSVGATPKRCRRIENLGCHGPPTCRRSAQRSPAAASPADENDRDPPRLSARAWRPPPGSPFFVRCPRRCFSPRTSLAGQDALRIPRPVVRKTPPSTKTAGFVAPNDRPRLMGRLRSCTRSLRAVVFGFCTGLRRRASRFRPAICCEPCRAARGKTARDPPRNRLGFMMVQLEAAFDSSTVITSPTIRLLQRLQPRRRHLADVGAASAAAVLELGAERCRPARQVRSSDSIRTGPVKCHAPE